jgi:hypothetical protein
LRRYLECTWERRESLLESVSQASWKCAIECNWEHTSECTSECTWEHAMKVIWQLAFKFVVCTMMYTIQRTKSHAYHSNVVNV